MLLAIEIYLTIVAWRKGWGARTLLAWLGCVVVFFVIGAASAAGGADMSDAGMIAIGILGDVLLIGILAVMAGKEPQSAAVSVISPIAEHRRFEGGKAA